MGTSLRKYSIHPGWPAHLGPLTVGAGRVTLRPIRLRDAAAWSRIRIRDQEHLEPWEPTGEGPWEDRHHIGNWPGLCASLRSEARKGRMVPLVIELDGESHFTDASERYDEARTGALAAWRIAVIRFTNSEVLQQFEAVCAKIEEALARPLAP